MKKVYKGFLPNRRQVLKAGIAAGVGMAIPWRFLPARVFAASAIPGLSDPAKQPKFVNPVPDALAPDFIYRPDKKGRYAVKIGSTMQQTGLVDKKGNPLSTRIWGYGDDKYVSWPGRTFQIQSSPSITEVDWYNELGTEHLLQVDTNLHWCYSLHGYTDYHIEDNGVPIITHLHGGHSDYQFDGNPEFFYSPGGAGQVVGPQWADVPAGFTTRFEYDNNVQAGNLWYHDHALGITRLNVYAGLAGFYFIRDSRDTGEPGNPLGLPAWPYEKAYAIQDRMFWDDGELFYPAYPGDPYYDDFITGEGAILPSALFPDGGPTALAEFFGDHMVVNGMIWPVEEVEPCNYRLRLLNGTDSRFMAIRFREVRPRKTDLKQAGPPLPFYVIGSDQGLADNATLIGPDGYLLFEPGSRYDVVFDFTEMEGKRIIMENIGGDEPFGGDIPGPQIFGETDRVMAFDVKLPRNIGVEDSFSAEGFDTAQALRITVNTGTVSRVRKVALFEGKDEYGRLQPLLGTAEPATDFKKDPINWPPEQVYQRAMLPDGTESPLVGQMEGAIAWHSPTTENPKQGTTEEWEIWNMTGDAHPVHLHLVHFEVLEREDIVWDTATGDGEGEYGRVADPKGDGVTGPPVPNDDGTYLLTQPTVQHNSVPGDKTTYGMGFKVGTPTKGEPVPIPDGYVENTPKDMVTALPGQVTRIRMKFDKQGRYVWHCHILSHEDHEMMRVMHVGPGA
ncbi:MAG: spore coat protein A [Desulforhopalus sp.]|jgi:spore coat protein A